MLDRQQGLCAMSGEPMTCNLQRGVVTSTNASLDKLDPDKGYILNNVQLVCRVLNSFRNNTPLDEYIEWCRKVVRHDEKTKLRKRI
jgi:hypothetical protein